MLQVTQAVGMRPGWVDRVLEFAPTLGFAPGGNVLRAQIEQGHGPDRDAILTWAPSAQRYSDLLSRFLGSVARAYGYAHGADLTVEYLIKGFPARETFKLPMRGLAIASHLQSRKVTAKDVITLVLLSLGDDLAFDVELDEHEQAITCSLVVRKVILPAVAPFITSTHHDQSVAGNGELMATALSDSSTKFMGSLAMVAPVPIEY